MDERMGSQLMEITRMSAIQKEHGCRSTEFKYMDINTARCIQRHINMNTTGLRTGIHNYTSESIKFVCCSGYTRPDNTHAPERRYGIPQTTPFRPLPSPAGPDSGHRRFPGMHFDNFLRTVPLPSGSMPET